jgi:hypothetical protein
MVRSRAEHQHDGETVTSGRALLVIWAVFLTSGLVSALAVHHSVPALAAASHQDVPPKPGATPIVIGIAIPTPSGAVDNSLTAPQKQRLILVAVKSPYVKHLVGRRSYRVSDATPWLDRYGKLRGGVVHLDFVHPAKIAGTWLASGRKPYRATYRNVKGLLVYVGLKRLTVMIIAPR